MAQPMDYVLTSSVTNRTGVKMRTERYNQISEFILQTLEQENEVTINKLIEKAHYRFWDELKEETGWYIFHVKVDMEARGLLRTERCVKKKITYIVKNTTVPKRRIRRTVARVATPPRSTDTLALRLRSKFIELFGAEPIMIKSPGVVNIIGDHGEYNNGFIMQAATDRGLLLAFGPSLDEKSAAYSFTENRIFTVDEHNDTIDVPSWLTILRAVVAQVQLRRGKLPSFHCAFYNDTPSQCSLERCPSTASGFAFALNTIFNLQLSELEIIRIAQIAKGHRNLRQGIVSQFTSLLAKESNVLMLDCQRLTYVHFPFDLKEYCLLLCDTSLRQTNAENQSETIKAECEMGLAIIKSRYSTIGSLKDITLETLLRHAEIFPPNVLKRCQFMVQENERVHQVANNLELCKLRALGQAFYKSHEGLSKLLEVSTPQVDFVVERTKTQPGVLGAKMVADGTGGKTLNLVHKSSVNSFQDAIGTAFQKRFGLEITFQPVKLSCGANTFTTG